MAIEKNKDYIHHSNPVDTAAIREGVFGLEDGMVSTMGAITGIATATGNYFTVILAGSVVIGVESIAMAVGSYLSSKSEKEIDERMLYEEKMEIKNFPKEEQEEAYEMFMEDGWSKKLSKMMAIEVGNNKDLMLREMAYRELKIIPDNLGNPFYNAVIMGIAYVIGGSVPLLPYFIFHDLYIALPISICITLFGLFVLGAGTTKFSKRSWWKAGLEMVALASVAALIGFGVGQGVEIFF